MQIEITQSVRDDGAILLSVNIQDDINMKNLARNDRNELAIIFMKAATNLMESRPTFKPECDS